MRSVVDYFLVIGFLLAGLFAQVAFHLPTWGRRHPLPAGVVLGLGLGVGLVAIRAHVRRQVTGSRSESDDGKPPPPWRQIVSATLGTVGVLVALIASLFGYIAWDTGERGLSGLGPPALWTLAGIGLAVLGARVHNGR